MGLEEKVKRNFDREFNCAESVLLTVSRYCGLEANASTEPLCLLLVTKYRTFTIPGYAFRMDRRLRIGFGGEAKELNEGLTRLGSAMNEMTMKPGLRV